ncbi:MAG: PilN domain-containing protein [Betaproteobacteria bacterium]
MELSVRFRQGLRDVAQRLGLPPFWRWWMDELAPLVPAGARGAVQRRRVRPVLAFGGEVAVLWMPRMHAGALAFVEAARIPLAGDAVAVAQAGRAAIESLPPSVYGGPAAAAKVVVALPPGQVLRKRLTLPAAIEENLKQALAYDLDRHTPFRPDQLYFDAAVVGRNAERRELSIDWAAVLRTNADAARRMAEGWGATVVGVTPDTLSGEGSTPIALSKLNLLPADARPNGTLWRRWQWWGPLAALGVMLAIAVLLPIWQKRDYAIALGGVADKARVEAEAADGVRQQVEALAADYNFALGQKYAYPGVVQLLDDVTKLMPDDTWLTQLELRTTARGKEPKREIALRGESANAGRIVSLLEESKLFADAAPRSPTTKFQPGPGEIFDLGAQLQRMTPPPLVVIGSEGALPPVLPPPAPVAGPPEPAVIAPAPAAATGTPMSAAAAPTPIGAPAPAVAPAAAEPAPAANGSDRVRRDRRGGGGRGGVAPVEPPAPPERLNPKLVDD